jgi:alkyl hydroperoxide reductase subunit AhpC
LSTKVGGGNGRRPPGAQDKSVRGKGRFACHLICATEPICITEVAVLANWSDDFRASNARVMNLWRSGMAENREWIAQIESMFGVLIEFPLVSDPDGRLLKSFRELHEKENARFCIRKFFIIDPAMRVRAILEYRCGWDGTSRNCFAFWMPFR